MNINLAAGSKQKSRKTPRIVKFCAIAAILVLVTGISLLFAHKPPTGKAQENRNVHDKHPNIVFILADDLGWADVGFNNSEIETPHIDWLAKKGIRLAQHYVQPMCTPTRVALLTGKYPSRFGDHATYPCNEKVLPFGTVTLSAALKSVGYGTAISGKWHLGSDPINGPLKFGFDHSYGSLAGGVGPYNHRYKNGPYSYTWHRNDELIEEEGHSTDLIVREAIRYIEKAGDNPLFLYIPFTAVHVPVEVPKKWLDFYEGKLTDESYRYYAAYTTQMDDGIGQVLEALRRTGRMENTLIVFTSDNGSFPSWKPTGKYPGKYREMKRLGSNLPYRGYKAELYEGAIHVPTTVYWPGILEGNRLVDAPTHIVDWMPTLCAIAGYQNNDLKWDGIDIMPLLKGKETSSNRTFYWKFAPPNSTISGSALRSGDWKLILHKGTAELFNLASDPFEKQDVAAKNSEKVKELKALLAEFASQDNLMHKNVN